MLAWAGRGKRTVSALFTCAPSVGIAKLQLSFQERHPPAAFYPTCCRCEERCKRRSDEVRVPLIALTCVCLGCFRALWTQKRTAPPNTKHPYAKCNCGHPPVSCTPKQLDSNLSGKTAVHKQSCGQSQHLDCLSSFSTQPGQGLGPQSPCSG